MGRAASLVWVASGLRAASCGWPSPRRLEMPLGRYASSSLRPLYIRSTDRSRNRRLVGPERPAAFWFPTQPSFGASVARRPPAAVAHAPGHARPLSEPPGRSLGGPLSPTARRLVRSTFSSRPEGSSPWAPAPDGCIRLRSIPLSGHPSRWPAVSGGSWVTFVGGWAVCSTGVHHAGRSGGPTVQREWVYPNL